MRAYRSLRLRSPLPVSRAVGRLAYAPRLARGHAETVREFREERLIGQLLRDGTALAGIGAGCSERVVEIPWVLRTLAAERGLRVLDVGTAFAPMVYKRLVMRLPHSVEVVDLADAEIPGVVSHRADVRTLPFAADAFDLATCISTLEHVGMDNAQYDVHSGGGGDVQALAELGRVAPRVLVTVPGGTDADMGWQRVYAPETFVHVAAEAGLEVARMDLFAHDPGRGWAPASEEQVLARRYGGDAVNAAASICAELRRP
jgi:hypothetical protein